MDNVPGSPFRFGKTVEEELAYYKAQYEQLEFELQEFQASSRELEAELEKDVEASEKRERKLKEKVESLGFEVEEWKGKHKQAKVEANSAQNALQKEVTTLREANRSLQLTLRDIEVANDDYERQARNTSSSLEDLESKYNVAIERGVMLEEEVRVGEQEREGLRIETQRLRDELSDLRVEAEITIEKLRTAEATIEKLHVRKPLFLTQDTVLPRSPTSEVSRTTTSSPTMSTPPPPRSEASSGAPTPPSPPLSDASANPNTSSKTDSLPFRRRSFVPDLSATPRPANSGASRPRHSRAPSLVSSAATSKNRMPPPSRPNNLPEGLPRSSSLYQIKGLIGRMQKIEERVHSVRSKLPPSSTTTPKASPRLASRHSPRLPSVTVGAIPGGITVRSSARKRAKRLSFGVPQGGPVDRSATATPSSRPSSSRSSNTSHSSAYPYARPSSRSGAPSARTPSALGFHSSQPFVPARPRSSLGGNYTSQPKRGHAHSTSVSESRDESKEAENTMTTPSAVRRLTLDKSGIPTPTALKRQSGGFSSSVYGRRPSVAGQHLEQSMPPPPEIPRKLTDVGETY
ncbi:NUDE protein [Delphinella strobiligena]|nr:NUDE protein [Delphinella strobiligena]